MTRSSPILTLLAHPERPSLDEAQRVAAEVGPLERETRSLELITRTRSGHWRVRWRWAMSS